MPTCLGRVRTSPSRWTNDRLSPCFAVNSAFSQQRREAPGVPELERVDRAVPGLDASLVDRVVLAGLPRAPPARLAVAVAPAGLLAQGQDLVVRISPLP
jgi:hypothetical protein